MFYASIVCLLCHFGICYAYEIYQIVFIIKSNQTLFSDLYKYKHVIHYEIYILEKRMEKKLNNL